MVSLRAGWMAALKVGTTVVVTAATMVGKRVERKDVT
jgi:hypothetical protein